MNDSVLRESLRALVEDERKASELFTNKYMREQAFRVAKLVESILNAQPPARAPAAGEGFVVVPVEPSDAMLSAGAAASLGKFLNDGPPATHRDADPLELRAMKAAYAAMIQAAPATQVADYNVRTSAGLNNACAKMHMKEDQGASDALYELAVKHGAPEAAAAGFAHTVNNAMIALHEQAIDWTQPAAAPAVVVDWSMVATLRKLRTDVAAMKEDPYRGDAVFRCGLNGGIDCVLGRIDAALTAAMEGNG